MAQREGICTNYLIKEKLEVPGEETANEWQEPVPDEEYGAL